MVYREQCGSRSDALRRECAVKALSHDAKERLIAGRIENLVVDAQLAGQTVGAVRSVGKRGLCGGVNQIASHWTPEAGPDARRAGRNPAISASES